MAPESIETTEEPASRARRLRRRCLLAALMFTAVLAATTFDFRPLLPDDARDDGTMLVLVIFLYIVWPASLLGLVGSVALYFATLIRPDTVARMLLRSTK